MNKDPRKSLDVDTVAELEALDVPALNKRIAESSEIIREAKRALEESPEYQEIMENRKAFAQGYQDLKKRQDAIIKVCLDLRKGDAP